jgi:hypothetical protein
MGMVSGLFVMTGFMLFGRFVMMPGYGAQMPSYDGRLLSWPCPIPNVK